MSPRKGWELQYLYTKGKWTSAWFERLSGIDKRRSHYQRQARQMHHFKQQSEDFHFDLGTVIGSLLHLYDFQEASFAFL